MMAEIRDAIDAERYQEYKREKIARMHAGE